MRIVAGDFGGRVIDAPDGRGTRPTTDRVRESVFSSIYSRRPDLSGTAVLDAFAGSGALGIEALSRGAASCVFYEMDRSARVVLSKNLSSLKLSKPRVEVRGADVLAAAQTGSLSAPEPFGLVLLDPPYALEASQVRAFLEQLAQAGALEDECVIVYEHALANKADVAREFDGHRMFEVTGQKKYGKIGVTYLKYAAQTERS